MHTPPIILFVQPVELQVQLQDLGSILAERIATTARCGARVQQLKTLLKSGDAAAVAALDNAHRRTKRLHAQVHCVTLTQPP